MKLSRLIKRAERRSDTVAASDPYLGEFFGQRGGLGGYVDTEKASGHSVAIACQSLISSSLSQIPLKLYRKMPNGGREAATEHPLYDVLQSNFNPQLEAYHGREWTLAAALQHGNAYARIETNGRGQVVGLYPYDPRMVSVEQLASGRLRYKVTSEKRGTLVLLQEEMLHIRYRTQDGIMGLSPVQHARQTFALALSQNDEAASQSENAFRPSVVISLPQKVGADNKQTLFDNFIEKFIGSAKANKPIILDGGAEVKPFSQNSKDAEFLESRKLSNLDVCRIYNVPPSAVGITDNATYSNIGEESRALVTRCLAPWAKRVEQAMNSALLTPESRKRYFIEHDLAGLLRGDLTARYAAYKTGKEGGWLNANEIRGFENMPEIEGGDEYLTPLNMKPAGQAEQGTEAA